MKVLVTGGAGFIGSHVADACLAAGHDVLIIDDLSTGRRTNLPADARFYEVDLCDAEAMEGVFASERPEVVCHLAARANVRESMVKPLLYAQTNIIGSLILLEMARKYHTRKVVYASTGGAVYGEPEYLPVDEDHPINPLDPYGASKHHVEHYLAIYRTHFDVDYTALRFPNVYGPRQDPYGEAGVVAIFANQMLRGETPVIYGSGEQERDFVYVADIARANELALTRASGEILNLGSGVGTSINTIFHHLRAITGCDCDEVHGPAKQGEVFRTYLNAARAKASLGWEPTVGLQDGLTRTVAYFCPKR
ncbi:MAG TPA: NAD-dependent epimerase/dehydratase family protein [Chloroflexi bacterium]|jgi:UDP-glucose 4-epimerase|nr:NAD-dependent epimerase/dehydratase family protein [Chloroflexota bacterium]